MVTLAFGAGFDVLSIRLLTTAALLALLPRAAAAEDEWFSKQFAPAAIPAPARPAPQAAAAIQETPPGPPAPAWRTVVIPAAVVVSTPYLISASTAPSRHATTVPHLKPLTGYAHELRGLASYYWQEQMTSSGERFNRHGLTAAHKTLPLGTLVRVTNMTNGKSTIVRINDRGPFKPGRVIDLSEAAALQIQMTGAGLARVAIDVVR